MKALSIKQPWAALIVRGEKDVENRTWSTQHRGLILIHASKRICKYGQQLHGLPRPTACGAIIGVARLVDCRQYPRKSKWHEEGMWGWYLEQAMLIGKPIPCRGQLRLFEVPDWDGNNEYR
jgi:hypothetical protein